MTPSAPVFPDGVMTPFWIAKHQALLPSAFLSFFAFTADPNLSSLHDNQLKTQIASMKRSFVASGYKTRFVVVLLSEQSILEAPDVEDRLGNIRRGAGLEPKNSLFFLPPRSSPVEMRAFVGSILTTLQPLCVEYYRELSKHSRRKRNRGSVPPPTAPPTYGTLRTLSSQGWNVRYEFKLGVLAEFRQEMDAAARNFEGAYEGLLGPDVFESIASWSPRWNEARLLADVIAIRILRSLLWNAQTHVGRKEVAGPPRTHTRPRRSSGQGLASVWLEGLGGPVGAHNGRTRAGVRLTRLRNWQFSCHR